MILLGGDIGGTKTWLQITQCSDSHCEVLHEQRFDSQAYADFYSLLKSCLAAASVRKALGDQPIAAGCLGIAGPVEQLTGNTQLAHVTNLLWRIDSAQLERTFGIGRMRLINDFEAIGHGIEGLAGQDMICLQAGEPAPRGSRVVIGAGTGLGQGILVWRAGNGPDNGGYDILATEGGHADFAPGSAVQRELITYLAGQLPRVRVEDVLSGRGLVQVFRFVVSQSAQSPARELQQALAAGDPAPITQAAVTGQDALARQAVELFCACYGTQAGNLALTCLATGGVYVAGGIAPRIRDIMAGGGFLRAFRDKAPMDAIMARIPVYLLLDTQLGLKGAVRVARGLAQNNREESKK